MSDDLTPWEEINPQRGLAQRAEPRSTSSERETRLVFRNELTACLALVAPAGMNEDGRREWLAVAWDTLKDIPPDILTLGARKAREQCDHPSKIVPTIIAETKDWMRLQSERPNHDEPLRITGPKPEYCSAEDAAKILEQYGLKSHFVTRIVTNYPTKPVE